MKVKDLKQDKRNANKHTEKGDRLLDLSISELGAGRSILIDKDNNVIAGNGVQKAILKNNPDAKVIIVETDGTELVAVKRKDVSIDSKKGRELAIADNQTAKEGINFDFDILDDLDAEFDIDLNTWEFEPILEDIKDIDIDKNNSKEKDKKDEICPKCGFKWEK